MVPIIRFACGRMMHDFRFAVSAHRMVEDLDGGGGGWRYFKNGGDELLS